MKETTTKQNDWLELSFENFFDLTLFSLSRPFPQKSSPDEIVAAAELQARAFYTSYPLGPLDALMFYQFRVRKKMF